MRHHTSTFTALQTETILLRAGFTAEELARYRALMLDPRGSAPGLTSSSALVVRNLCEPTGAAGISTNCPVIRLEEIFDFPVPAAAAV